ncbi:hypothetical protein [Nonomuraea glycinis]|uniref:hypothetical protein n=1 Tax=Nonomuraea glycinis TaxID=2047744 RepID=UPI002E0FA6C1|nr:hypothetical protein OHA68_14720 [Nonomuraea glycinis]
MRSEEDLIRTLRTAADQAAQPPAAPGSLPPGSLSHAVAARRRARRFRQRAQVALAAAAVVIVAGGTAAVLSYGGGQAQPAVTVENPTVDEPRLQVKPAAEVWPGAVVKMPAKAADGWKYRPVTGISPTEVLVTAESSFEKPGRLEVYDTSTGTARVVGEMPAPEGVKGYFSQAVEVGEKYYAWYGETPNNSDKWADFWIMPREGGTARQVGEVTGDLSRVERIGVTDDHLVWSVRQGGVYRIPLAGGAPEKIDGTDGLHLTSWPLAAGYAPGKSGEKNQNRVVNLETGQSTAVEAPPGTTRLTCLTDWCFGAQRDRTIVQRIDGSGQELLPEGVGFFSNKLLGERFAVVSLRAGGDPAESYIPVQTIYDPTSGKIGGVHRRSAEGSTSYGFGTSSSPTTIMYWDEDKEAHRECRTTSPSGDTFCEIKESGGGKEFTVLNTLAITSGS